MKKRERWVVAGLLLVLSLLSAWGVRLVLQKSQPQQVEAFANRFVSFETLGVTASDEVALSVETNALNATWPQTAGPLSITSQPLKLPQSGHAFLQMDLYIGGTQNARGAARFGYRVWLTAALYTGDTLTKTARLEIPLESDKERSRLYSLRVPYGKTQPDHYTLAWSVEPLDGTVEQGTLKSAWLEVIP